jgi:glycosyltransferase involved in cell wall biosynthesis
VPSVGFITSDFTMNVDPPQPNGCAWYRMVLPSRALAALGWETGVGLPRVNEEAGIGLAHLDGALYGWDVNVFKLLMHEATATLIRTMQAKGSRIVIDVDDFHFGIDEENVAASSTNPYTNPKSNRAFYEMGIRAADTVTVSTAFLADFYNTRVRDVRIVRNALDVDRFEMVEQPETPTFGWVGGTWWRSGDIELLSEWLPQFVKDHGVGVHHSGHIPSDSKHFGVRAGLKRVTTEPMKLIRDYPSLLQHFHVGLVPLTRQPFNEAKSYLKGLEYAAAGIPFIATPTEEYRLLHEAGVGRLAEGPDEWADHARELLDPQVRRSEAARQRKIVEEQFNISHKGLEWDTALRG